MNKLVSVIVPTYNREEDLKRAVRSILNQTYENLEIIIVSDHEKDISQILPSDEKIKIINREGKEGVSSARNVGIENARGQYITFLDDDDEYLPQKVEKQVKKMETLSRRYGAVSTGGYVVKDGEVIGERLGYSNNSEHKVRRAGKILSVTPLVKEKVFKDVGRFDENLPSAEDLDMWYRIMKKYKIANIPKPLIRYHIEGEGRISSDHRAKAIGEKKFVEKHYSRFKDDPEVLSLHYQGIGKELLYFNRKKGLKYLIKSLELQFNIKTLLLIFISILPRFMIAEILNRKKLHSWENRT